MNLVSLGAPALALRSHVTARVEAMTPPQRGISRVVAMLACLVITSLLSAEPALAQSNFEGVAQAFLDILSNGLLRIIATIAVIAVGLGWLSGRINTGAAVTVVAGIAIIFSAPWIVSKLGAG